MAETMSDILTPQKIRDNEWIHFQLPFILRYWKPKCDEFGLDNIQMMNLWAKFFHGVGGVFKQLDITLDDFTVKLEQMCDQLFKHFMEFKYFLSIELQMDVGFDGAIEAICNDKIKSLATIDPQRGLAFSDVYFPNIQTTGEVRTRFVFMQNSDLCEELADITRDEALRLLTINRAVEIIAA